MDARLEERYVVIKMDRLTYDDFLAFLKFFNDIQMGYATVGAVVIEEDWPEYTPTVDLLMKRVDNEQ